TLLVAPLDTRERATLAIDLRDLGERATLDVAGQRFDGVSASERVDRLRDAGFLRDDLLRSQGDPDRLLGRQPERFVECVGVERLSAAEYSGERLDRCADDVVARLLRRERRAHRDRKSTRLNSSHQI